MSERVWLVISIGLVIAILIFVRFVPVPFVSSRCSDGEIAVFPLNFDKSVHTFNINGTVTSCDGSLGTYWGWLGIPGVTDIP